MVRRNLDPDAPPTVSFNLRLNEYEISLLRATAKTMRRSQQQTVKNILIGALESPGKATPEMVEAAAAAIARYAPPVGVEWDCDEERNHDIDVIAAKALEAVMGRSE